MNYLNLFYAILKQYNDEMEFRICSNDKLPHCYIEDKVVYFPAQYYLKLDISDLIDVFHEIGHIITNKVEMKECVKEYLATQWAFDQLKVYKITIPQTEINRFQKYIWSFRRAHCPSREELTLR